MEPEAPDNSPSTKEVGDVLEKNVEYIFKHAGFEVKRNVREAGYEIDVLAKFGDRKVIVECKNYQKSHLVIRNLIHQWSGKNDIIKADKVILVVYGVKVKKTDLELAKKYDIEVWGEERINSLFSLLMQPEKLKKELLKNLRFRRVSIADKYKSRTERRIFIPILSGEEEDSEETFELFLDWIKQFIRTQLRLEGTEREERLGHVQLFENYDEDLAPIEDELEGEEEWDALAERLSKKKILSTKQQKEYLHHMRDLEHERENIIEWFEGTSETVVRRLIQARVQDILFHEKIAELGFNRDETVTVLASSGHEFTLQLESLDERDVAVLNWILTSESQQYMIEREDEDSTEEEPKITLVEISEWSFSSVEQASEAVFRILDEYYGYKEGDQLFDFTLIEPTPPQKSLLDQRCFIATAAWQTPFSQELIILRNWRDSYLQQRKPGRAFVNTYYRLAPPIANFIENKPLLRKVTRTTLRPLVNILRKRGY